jgi:hypothetical protein
MKVISETTFSVPDYGYFRNDFQRTVRVSRSLVLYVCFVDRFCPFVLFPLAIVLSVPLRYTDYDCPFGIFKLFLR